MPDKLVIFSILFVDRESCLQGVTSVVLADTQVQGDMYTQSHLHAFKEDKLASILSMGGT